MRSSVGQSGLFSSVLCPVDFSDHSRVALRFASALSRRAEVPLRVLFVNDPLLVAAAAAAYNVESLGAATETELKRFVTSTLTAKTAKVVAPTFGTALGKPPREILRAVTAGGYGLIVVGTKGLNGAKRLMLGSTTSALLATSPVPVLAVPPADAASGGTGAVPASWPGRAIVAAIELGPHATSDVARAAEVARWFGVRLVLVHVVPMPTPPAWFSADLDTHLRHDCDRAERALQTLASATTGVKSTVCVRIGHPPDEIATVAREHHAGLIVMAIRGRAGLFGEAAGSCTYQVLCHGVAPVLALPDLARAARRSR